jgi:hypothetical protein
MDEDQVAMLRQTIRKATGFDSAMRRSAKGINRLYEQIPRGETLGYHRANSRSTKGAAYSE